jgi:hypothetical protein
VGRVFTPDRLEEAGARFVSVAAGASAEAAGFSSGEELVHASMDIRAYYEEAALALMDHVPAARSVEAWIYGSTEMGKLLVAASDVVNRAGDGERFAIKYHIVPTTYFEEWQAIDTDRL